MDDHRGRLGTAAPAAGGGRLGATAPAADGDAGGAPSAGGDAKGTPATCGGTLRDALVIPADAAEDRQGARLLLGFETSGDAAVYRLGDDAAAVLTVDFFTRLTFAARLFFWQSFAVRLFHAAAFSPCGLFIN